MKILKYIFICTVLVLTASCNEKKKVMEPEEVVESFTRAVAAGDFCAAKALCDTVSMKDYLENYRMVMNSLQKEDSSALAIAASMLAGAEFEVVGTGKSDEGKTIEFRLTTGGNEKTKKATVKKEEGEWKVTSITDAI